MINIVEKFVPYNKMSKKAQKEYNFTKRNNRKFRFNIFSITNKLFEKEFAKLC